MSFAVPIRSKREPGRRASGLARIFMKSMKDIKLNKPANVSCKDTKLSNKTIRVAESSQHDAPTNHHDEDNKTESETVEKSSSTNGFVSNEENNNYRKHSTEETETRISQCDNLLSSTHLENNSNGESTSNLIGNGPRTDLDIQAKDRNNNTVSSTFVHETTPVVQSENSALSESLVVNHAIDASVSVRKDTGCSGMKSAVNHNVKINNNKSSRFISSSRTTNRSRQEQSSVSNKPRRFSQRRHSNNSRERALENVEPEDWSSDLLEVEIKEGTFLELSEIDKNSGFSGSGSKDATKINIEQNEKLGKDKEENIKCENLDMNVSDRSQQECNRPSSDVNIALSENQQECNWPSSDVSMALSENQQECNRPSSDVNIALSENQQECNRPSSDVNITLSENQQECNRPSSDVNITLSENQQECNWPSSDVNIALSENQQKCNKPDSDVSINVNERDQQEMKCNRPDGDVNINISVRDKQEYNRHSSDVYINLSEKNQQELNRPFQNTEIDCLTNAERKATEEKDEVNLEMEWDVDKSQENFQISENSLTTNLICGVSIDYVTAEESSAKETIIGECLDKEQSSKNNHGNETVCAKSLDLTTGTFNIKQLEDENSAREDPVFNTMDKEQDVSEKGVCKVEQDSETEKDIYFECYAYSRKDGTVKTECGSANIGIKTGEECERQTEGKFETTDPETNTVKQSENVVLLNEESGDMMKKQQCELLEDQKCGQKISGEYAGPERQECLKDRQKQPLTCCGNLEDMNTEDSDSNKQEARRIKTPPLRVPVCDIPAYYNRQRNSIPPTDTNNTSYSSSSETIPNKDIGCCNSQENKTASIPSLLDLKFAPCRVYSSASSDSSSPARSSRLKPRKPKKKNGYNKSIARGHTLTVSPIQRSPSGSPISSYKGTRGRKSGNDSKATYNSLINSKVQALSAEIKSKVSSPSNNGGRTMMAKPVMYRDSLRAMKQIRRRAAQENPSSTHQVRSDKSEQKTSKMEPIIIAQVSSEPKIQGDLEFKSTDIHLRSYSESSKGEISDCAKNSRSKFIIIPQVSSEPAAVEIEDHVSQKSRNPESQKLDILDVLNSREKCSDVKNCDNQNFERRSSTGCIQQQRLFQGHNSPEHVRQENSPEGHKSSNHIRQEFSSDENSSSTQEKSCSKSSMQDKSFQSCNISSKGHNSSQRTWHESSSQGHNSSKSAKQVKSCQGHSVQPLGQNSTCGNHRISESVKNTNSGRDCNNSQQNYSTNIPCRSKPKQQNKSYSTHNRSEPAKWPNNSSTTQEKSKHIPQDKSFTTVEKLVPKKQGNSFTTDNSSELITQNKSYQDHSRSGTTKQDESSVGHNSTDLVRQDNSAGDHCCTKSLRQHENCVLVQNKTEEGAQNNSSKLTQRNNSTRSQHNSERKSGSAGSSEQDSSQHGKNYNTKPSSYHQDSSGPSEQDSSRHSKNYNTKYSSYHQESSGPKSCFQSNSRSSSDPRGSNNSYGKSVSNSTLKRQDSSESQGSIGLKKDQGWRKPVCLDPRQTGPNSMESMYRKSPKKYREKSNASLKSDREANGCKQVETSEFENWDTDLLPVVMTPSSNVHQSGDRMGVTTTSVSMLTSGRMTEDVGDRNLEGSEKGEKGKVQMSETTSYDDEQAIKFKEQCMDEKFVSESCDKITHYQAVQDKTDQQQEKKFSKVICEKIHPASQHNSRSVRPDYKNSVTFSVVKNGSAGQRQVNDLNIDNKNTACQSCDRSQLRSSSNTRNNCVCRETSFSKGKYWTSKSESLNTGWNPSSEQHHNYSMEKDLKINNHQKFLDRIEENEKSSKYKSDLTVDSKSSKCTEKCDNSMKNVLSVQPNNRSGFPACSGWKGIEDQRKNHERNYSVFDSDQKRTEDQGENYERKYSVFDSDQEQNKVLDGTEENWDSHLLDIEGILKTQKIETMEQVVPSELETRETSILKSNDCIQKSPERSSHAKHQLEEWDSTLLDLNLTGTSSIEQEDKIVSPEEILPEYQVNNDWCESPTCVESDRKMESGLPVTSAGVDNVDEEDGSIIPQSDSSFSGAQETSEIDDASSSDDVLESYVFLSQEECCAQDIPIDTTSCTQTSTDQETEEKFHHKQQNHARTYRPNVSSTNGEKKYVENSGVDFRAMENDYSHRPDLKHKRGRPPGYGPEQCVCPPDCVQFWTWRCCLCRWGWKPRICDIRSAVGYSDHFTPQSTEDKDSAEKGIRMGYSPRGLLAMRPKSVIPPPPSRELWNQMQQGITPVNPLSPRGTGPPPTNTSQTRKPPRMWYPGSYPYPQEHGSEPEHVMSYGMRHCTPYNRLQLKPSSSPSDRAPVEQNISRGRPINNYSESSRCVSYMQRNPYKNTVESQNPKDSSPGLASARECVSPDEMQELQLNSPKLVDYGSSETDDSEEEKKEQLAKSRIVLFGKDTDYSKKENEQLVKSRIVLFGKDDQSQDSDCSSEKRKLDTEGQEVNDDEDCGVGPKRRHVLPQNNIYHFIRHSLNTEPNKNEDEKNASAYVPPHRRQKISLADGSERDDQRIKENRSKTLKQTSPNNKPTEVSPSVSKPSSSSPGSYPWTPFWASPPPAMSMSVSPLFSYHQPPCMYPPNCYFSPPSWYHPDSYGGTYPQPSHSPSTNTKAVKSPTSKHPLKENVEELSKLRADQKTPERLVLPPRIQFLERTRLLGSNTDSESSSSFRMVDWKVNFKEKCKSYGGTFIDSHCHLDFLFHRQGYKGTWSEYKTIHDATMPESFEGCVAVFCHPGSFRQEGLWKEIALEDDVWLAFGCHPKNATEFSPRAEEGLIRCLQHKRVVALGEIGLDYSGIFKQHKITQKTVFIKQIQLALEMNKPLVIHCREAEEDALQILEETVPRNYRIHCHCFTGDYESAKKWMNLFPNLYIGLTPLVTYRTATPSHEVARFIPLDRLLLETDAPYFIPRKFPKEDVHFSHPGMAITVAEHVAFLKRCSVSEVLHACRQNTRTMYGV